jgi:uncharacterized protein (DUF305 family)
MAGRIKLLRNGVAIAAEDTPELPYDYDDPGPFDAECGTFGLDSFQLPNAQCPEEFVCDKETASPDVASYSTCIDAMNCNMLHGMTNGVKADDSRALFVHMMVPHHQNAINMAKSLLKRKSLQCDVISDEENPDCTMLKIMYDIVNQQNHQIQEMLGFLESIGKPKTDECKVEVEDILTSGSHRQTQAITRRLTDAFGWT